MSRLNLLFTLAWPGPGLGDARHKMKHWAAAAAAAAYEAAVARGGGNPNLYARLGDARHKMKHWAAAAAAYEAAVARGDGNPNLYARLGDAEHKMKHWAAAAAAYEAAVARGDGNPNLYARLGNTRQRMKQWAAAAAAYETAVARGGGNPNLYFRLGNTRHQMKDWAAAAVAYEAAVARGGGNPNLYFRLGEARHRMKHWAAAVAAYERALQLDPRKDLCRYRLAACLRQQGKQGSVDHILSPLHNKNDVIFIEFLGSRGITYSKLDKKTLLTIGLNTRTSRRILVQTDTSYKAYFEHTRVQHNTSDRRVEFYAYLRRKFDNNIPPFIPKLHYYHWTGEYGYFLYDYVEKDKALSHAGNGNGELPLRLKTKVVECLTRIKNEFYDFHDDKGGAFDIECDLSFDSAESYLDDYLNKPNLSQEYVNLLEQFQKQEARHYANFLSLPLAFSHNDIYEGNIICTTEGNVYIIDWESYGFAPIGFDLVYFFDGKWEGVDFEQMVDLYFDGIDRSISPKRRRYIVALVIIYWSVAENWALPRKWLHYANSYHP